MQKEQLQQLVQLIHATPCWEQTAQLLAMSSVLLNEYDHYSDAQRMAQIQRMRATVERLLRNDPLTLLHEALVDAERALEDEALRFGNPV